ncbi:hypothetical protein AB6D11_00785 [Vibrio splendidus]
MTTIITPYAFEKVNIEAVQRLKLVSRNTLIEWTKTRPDYCRLIDIGVDFWTDDDRPSLPKDIDDLSQLAVELCIIEEGQSVPWSLLPVPESSSRRWRTENSTARLPLIAIMLWGLAAQQQAVLTETLGLTEPQLKQLQYVGVQGHHIIALHRLEPDALCALLKMALSGPNQRHLESEHIAFSDTKNSSHDMPQEAQ